MMALVLGLTVISADEAFAYRGDSIERSTERHEAMEKAFEDNDYDAWKNLMQNRGRVTQLINKDNFSKFAEVHELMEDGKIEEARKIRQDLGLGLKNGSGRKGGDMMNGVGMGRKCNR